MEKQLKTMEQKMAENPNEIMENGLTRAQNDKIAKDGETLSGVVSLIVGIISIWCIIQVMS
jgi:hypothetical protein